MWAQVERRRYDIEYQGFTESHAVDSVNPPDSLSYLESCHGIQAGPGLDISSRAVYSRS